MALLRKFCGINEIQTFFYLYLLSILSPFYPKWRASLPLLSGFHPLSSFSSGSFYPLPLDFWGVFCFVFFSPSCWTLGEIMIVWFPISSWRDLCSLWLDVLNFLPISFQSPNGFYHTWHTEISSFGYELWPLRRENKLWEEGKMTRIAQSLHFGTAVFYCIARL